MSRRKKIVSGPIESLQNATQDGKTAEGDFGTSGAESCVFAYRPQY